MSGKQNHKLKKIQFLTKVSMLLEYGSLFFTLQLQVSVHFLQTIEFKVTLHNLHNDGSFKASTKTN